MSRYVQIDVRLLAAYGAGGLKDSFPRLHGLLQSHGYELVIEKAPSLYEMVEVLVRVQNDPHVSSAAKRPVSDKLKEFVKVRDEAREMLLSRRLNELDKLLYRLEDLFGDLEDALG